MMSEIDELERILSEKLEKDEEWRILEIGEVKPVNLGKLKKVIEKLPTPAIVLTILAKYFEKFKEKSIRITKFAKITFEVEKKVLEPIASRPVLKFEADNFGPFTTSIYDDLGFLENLNLVKVEKDKNIMNISLTEKGLKKFHEKISKEIPEELMRMIDRVVEEYGSLDYDALLDRVYKEYPEYTERSLIRGRYLF